MVLIMVLIPLGQWQRSPYEALRGQHNSHPAAHNSTRRNCHYSLLILELDAAAQVELESVSGNMDMHFLNADLTNAYRNLSNVVLALVPAAAASAPALLLGAHFDSTLDTPGACHSGVGRTLQFCSCKRHFRPMSSCEGGCIVMLHAHACAIACIQTSSWSLHIAVHWCMTRAIETHGRSLECIRT